MSNNPEQLSMMERAGVAVGNIYESIHQGMNSRIALGMSVLAFTGAALASAEPVGAADRQELKQPVLKFNPGRYEGTTAQTCTADAAETGVCEEGKKIPVSFTATKSKVISFKSAVINECFDKDANPLPDKTISLNFKPARVLAGRGFAAQETASNALTKPLSGNLHGTTANGKLGAMGSFNDVGKPDIEGDISCAPSLVTWQAKRLK